jgi:hypothetical protein
MGIFSRRNFEIAFQHTNVPALQGYEHDRASRACMNGTKHDPAGDILGQVDYRHIVAILQKHYPAMDAKEAARLVLECLRPRIVVPPSSQTAEESGAA